MRRIQILLVLFILIVDFKIALGMGLGDWSGYTPHKTFFNDPGGGTTITLANRKVYKSPSEWYFYKDHIIGKKINWTYGNEIEYFIIDEKAGKILKFLDKERWNAHIFYADLIPKYWTRWHSDNWNLMDALKLFAFFWFPITLIVILLNILFVYKIFKFEKPIAKWFFLVLITPFTIIILKILSDFPQSF